jgi:hypothetical protein
MGPNTTGNATTTCSATPDAGFFISSLTLTVTDDYTGFQSGSPTVNYGGTVTQSSPVFGSITFCQVNTSGSNSVPCAATVNGGATITGLDLGGYTFQLTSVANTVTNGVVTGDSIVVTLNYGETLIPGGVPEPTTLSLVGGALLGLGFLGRRKKK